MPATTSQPPAEALPLALTTAQAASMLGTTRAHVGVLSSQYGLPYFYLGGQKRYRPSDLAQYVDAQTTTKQLNPTWY
ncbi:helix-turn-helix domain-containing protein [Curtobacterium sp. MCPF17_031]|uniref:helix-turn-helix domain-containing protein n=1 Tax=Curtobacterium sp. MCPF17_031 TaxID=2175653 RepID=UPI000DA93B16|nr:helix-turn-helix domain-containing protein [Curtobacterium sp. MCPF17_031]PZE39739.1 DNA-binding protein [Curtobacterium sp. MCPF17_031]